MQQADALSVRTPAASLRQWAAAVVVVVVVAVVVVVVVVVGCSGRDPHC